MKMDLYLSQLLYRYQCVTIPGFGAFLTEIQSAQLHQNSNSFYPPKKLISFNPYIKNNDGLLANHIALAEKISYEVALSTINNQVVLWKSTLNESGTITLKNIGELALNSEHNLVFVPYDQVNYLTSSFGLTTFASPAVKREVYKEEIEVLEQQIPVSFTPEKRNSEKYFKYAAIFVLGAGLLGTGGFYGNQYYQNQIELQTIAIQTKVQKQVEQKIQEATFMIDFPSTNTKVVDEEKIVEKKSYHIVAGVYQKEFYANKLFNELQNLGYKPIRLEPNKFGMFPVLYGSFSSYTEAHNAMMEIKKSHNPDAWMMIKEI